MTDHVATAPAAAREITDATFRLAIGQLHDVLGRPLGTAFAISSTHVVTDRHCLDTRARDGSLRTAARVRFPGHPFGHYEEVTADLVLLDDLPESDVALLKCSHKLPDDLVPLVPTASVRKGPWNTTAWPDELEGYVDGARFTGTIEGLGREHGQPALELRCLEASAGQPASVHGASGAPVIASDLGPRSVVGVIRWNAESPDRPGAALGGRVFAAPAAVVVDTWAAYIPASNPYKQPLTPYQLCDSDAFFGRGGATRDLVEQLPRVDFAVLTIWGASGSGKSSLVRAGLLPLIAGGSVLGPHGMPGANWRLHGVLDAYDEADLGALKALRTHPAPSGCRDLLVLDQFERILTIAPDRSKEWCEELMGLLDAHPRLTTVVIIRTDYVAVLELRRPQLYAYVKRGMVPVDLTLSRSDVVDMCELPAMRAGLSFEPGLVDLICDHVVKAHPAARLSRHVRARAEPTVLPLVNILLWQLAERVGPGRHATKALYESVGDVTGP